MTLDDIISVTRTVSSTVRHIVKSLPCHKSCMCWTTNCKAFVVLISLFTITQSTPSTTANFAFSLARPDLVLPSRDLRSGRPHPCHAVKMSMSWIGYTLPVLASIESTCVDTVRDSSRSTEKLQYLCLKHLIRGSLCSLIVIIATAFEIAIIKITALFAFLTPPCPLIILLCLLHVRPVRKRREFLG